MNVPVPVASPGGADQHLVPAQLTVFGLQRAALRWVRGDVAHPLLPGRERVRLVPDLLHDPAVGQHADHHFVVIGVLPLQVAVKEFLDIGVGLSGRAIDASGGDPDELLRLLHQGVVDLVLDLVGVLDGLPASLVEAPWRRTWGQQGAHLRPGGERLGSAVPQLHGSGFARWLGRLRLAPGSPQSCGI